MRFDSNAQIRVAAAALALAVMAAHPAAGTATGVFTRGPATCHALAFTFDLCPVSQGTGFDAPLVKFLEEYRVHATFFASGRWMATHDSELRELMAQPFFEIGTHGQVHAHLPRLTAEAQSAEILGAVDTLAAKYGRRATLFRPPYGEYNDETLRAADAAGQTVVTWSVVSGDPDPKLPATGIIEDVVSRVKNGSVMIFHANGRGWHTSETVPAVYQRLVVAKRFATDTISELRSCTPSGK
jgi:peptidoglycan-N-acetylglucosamine deacetylase